jgi:hypothetical protein
MRKNFRGQIIALEAKLTNTAKSARRAGNRRMERGAVIIQEVAQTLAPIDKGNLEQAIELNVKRDSRGRNEYIVEVNTQAAGSGKADTVGKYIDRIYYDRSYMLGKESSEKDKAIGGNGLGYNYGGKVGPLFLERAFDKHVGKINKEVIDAMRRGLK